MKWERLFFRIISLLHLFSLPASGGTFELTEEVKGELGDIDKLLKLIATRDREALLEFATSRETEAEKKKCIIILAQAWFRNDFDWTVELLSRHEINPYLGGFPDRYFAHGRLPFDFLAKMPASWQQAFLKSQLDLKGDAVRWLTIKNHPALTKQQLKEIQEDIGIDFIRFDPNDIPKVQSLVNESDWLSDETKNWMVEGAVFGVRDRESLRGWVASLPPTINSEGLDALNYFRNQEKLRQQTVPRLSNQKSLSGYLKNPHREQRFSMNHWTADELRSFEAEIKKIEPEDADKLFRSVFVDYFPLRMRIHLIPKILAAPNYAETKVIRLMIRKTTEEFASSHPAKAAKWAKKIAPESLRVLALGVVAEEWRKQNEKETDSWLLTLPKTLQERFRIGA
jgi:hypothetical protein